MEIPKIKGLFDRTGTILILIALVVAAANFFFGQWLIGDIQTEKLQEKIVEVDREINIICDDIQYEVDKDEDWGEGGYDYDGKVSHTVGLIDRQYEIFACAYKTNEDGMPVPVSERTYESSPFDPLASVEFTQTIVNGADRGNKAIYWTPEGSDGRYMYTYWRWVPDPRQVEDPYLIVIAVSEFSIGTTTASWVNATSIALSFAFVGLALAFLIYAKKRTHTSEKGYGNDDDYAI